MVEELNSPKQLKQIDEAKKDAARHEVGGALQTYTTTAATQRTVLLSNTRT